MCIGHFVLRSTNRNKMSKDMVKLVKAMAKEMGMDLAELGSGIMAMEEAQDLALNLPASSAHF